MGSQDQSNTFLQQGMQNLGGLSQVLSRGIFATRVTGGTLGYSIGTASGLIVNISTTQQVVFHNLSATATIYICPQTDANGNVLTAGATTGNYTILPQMDRVLTAQGQWLAAATITATFLTVGLGLG